MSDVPICSADTIRLCARYWACLSEEVKDLWRKRAVRVNRLPRLGVFVEVPAHIEDNDVAKSMTIETDRIRSTLHYILRKRHSINPVESQKTRLFGKERVARGTKVYKSFVISHLLTCAIFGTNYCLLHEYEIAHRTKRVIVAHISSKNEFKNCFI